MHLIHSGDDEGTTVRLNRSRSGSCRPSLGSDDARDQNAQRVVVVLPRPHGLIRTYEIDDRVDFEEFTLGLLGSRNEQCAVARQPSQFHLKQQVIQDVPDGHVGELTA